MKSLWPISLPPHQRPHTRNGLTCDDPGDTAKAISHAKNFSFSTELYLKQLFLLPPIAFYPAIFKHQSNHSTPAIKMQWTKYLLYTLLRNHNNTSPQPLNKMDSQLLNERCSRFGKKLSHVLHPTCATLQNQVTTHYKEASGLLPSRPSCMGSGLN